MNQLRLGIDEIQQLRTDELVQRFSQSGFRMSEDRNAGAIVQVPVQTGIDPSGVEVRVEGGAIVFMQAETSKP